MTLAGSGIVWASGLVYVLTLDDPRLRFVPFLFGVAISSLGWLGLMRCDRQLSKESRLGPSALVKTLVVAAVALRLWAVMLPPAFSEDVFRYVYEGRLVWWYGWGFPFAHAPAAGPDLEVDPALLDAAWLRINHPELSTIYPPLAQLVFVAAGGLGEGLGGGHLPLVKLLLVAADLCAWRILHAAARSAPRLGPMAFAWGFSPLVILEVAREGHADSLSAFGLSLGIFGFLAARPRVGYAGWALAALAKLNGLIIMPAAARVTRRGILIAMALCTLIALPYLMAGGTSGSGLRAYASRWRAGDGAFTVVLGVSEALLGGEWARVGQLTLTRHTLARGLVAALFATWTLAIAGPAGTLRQIPDRAGLLLLGLLLLSPTLHPWYVIWLLPFVAAAPDFRGRSAAITLALLAPALHHPGWLELVTGEWTDRGWIRAVVHLPVWICLVAALVPSRRRG